MEVVPRAWSHIFLALIGEQPPTGNLPERWLTKWQPYATCALPTNWSDDKENYIEIPRRKEISEINMKQAQKVLSWFE